MDDGWMVDNGWKMNGWMMSGLWMDDGGMEDGRWMMMWHQPRITRMVINFSRGGVYLYTCVSVYSCAYVLHLDICLHMLDNI